MHIKSVSIGKIQSLSHNEGDYQTAINKFATREPIHATSTGLEGDEHANTANHGGIEAALCLYPIEHYPFFATHLGHELAAPAFGENLTAYGMTEREVCIGDQFQIGPTVIVEVSQPRVPCYKLNRKHNNKTMMDLSSETGFTGYCLRVLKEGPLTAGDEVKLLEQPNPDLTVHLAHVTRFGHHPTTNTLQHFIDCPHLTPKWRDAMTTRLEQLNT